MTIPQPSPGGGRRLARRDLLFTPGPRLGWIFRDRCSLLSPYPEPPPDPELIRQHAAARLAAAQRSWQQAKKWAARPSLIVAIAIVALAGCAHAISPGASLGPAVLGAMVLAGPGLGWSAWKYAQLSQARTADPAWHYRAQHEQWGQRAAAHEHAELARLERVPEWGSALSPATRTDVYGGTLAGWRSLLTVHGASIMATSPLLVADLSGQHAAAGLAEAAREAGAPAAVYLLPRDLDRCGLLAGLSARQFADALAEAIHAGPAGQDRTDRAVDVRVLGQLAGALAGNGLTPARVTAALQAALGRDYPDGLLTDDETGRIRGSLFGEDYQTRIGANLIRLDAFLSPLADPARAGPPADPPTPAWCTILAAEPAARSARSELIAALVIQWLTVQVTEGTGNVPAVIVAAADQITGRHLDDLSAACEHRSVPLTLIFRHLREDAIAMLGGGATAFMRLGNHLEAEHAAAFLGRHHKFVLSGWTATRGGDHTATRGSSESRGTSRSQGYSASRGWAGDPLSGSRSTARSADRSSSYSHGTEQSESDGTTWSEATNTARVYEYNVEPAVLQHLPDHALLLTAQHAGISLHAVECDPAIINLPHVSTMPLRPVPTVQPRPPAVPPQTGQPQIAPRHRQPQWPQHAPDDEEARPAQQWPRDGRRR